MHALRLATTLDIPLKILHVIKAPTDHPRMAADSRYLRSLKTAALLELGRLTRMAEDGGASARPLLLYGDPRVCILDTVGRTRVVMIVMGTEGRTGWDRLRTGSTAEGIVREALCPVLTVHGGLAGDEFRRPAKVRFKRLLVATDFSRASESALQIVRSLAPKLRAAIRIVHVTQASSRSGQADRMLAEHVRDLRSHGIEAEGVCVPGEPVETILAQAAAYQADLLAIGTSGRKGLGGMVLGGVAAALLKRAGCPVLTVSTRARIGKHI